MSDILFECIKKSMNFDEKEREKEYNELTQEEKFAADYELAKEVEKHVILVIDKLTDKEFKRLKTENVRLMNKFWKDFGIQYFDEKIRSGETSLDDLDKEFVKGQIAYEYFHRRPTKSVKEVLSKKKTLERMYILSKLQLLAFQTQVGARLYHFEPYFQINELVSRRFGLDENWTMAISILATHENLVKKKLSILGMPKEEIQQISRRKGLEILIEKLSELIEEKEKRNLSLNFYKSSALRKIRNKLEHEGYLQKVRRQDVLNLQKDIRDFELELYPVKQKMS